MIVWSRWMRTLPLRSLRFHAISATISRGGVPHPRRVSDPGVPVELALRAVWEAASEAVAVSDCYGLVLAANPAYYLLYGYTPDEVLGKSFAVIFSESERATLRPNIALYSTDLENRRRLTRLFDAATGRSALCTRVSRFWRKAGSGWLW